MRYIKNTSSQDIYVQSTGYMFYKNELLTDEEFSVFCPSLDKSLFSRVSVKKSDTIVVHGVRLEYSKGSS